MAPRALFCALGSHYLSGNLSFPRVRCCSTAAIQFATGFNLCLYLQLFRVPARQTWVAPLFFTEPSARFTVLQYNSSVFTLCLASTPTSTLYLRRVLVSAITRLGSVFTLCLASSSTSTLYLRRVLVSALTSFYFTVFAWVIYIDLSVHPSIALTLGFSVVYR